MSPVDVRDNEASKQKAKQAALANDRLAAPGIIPRICRSTRGSTAESMQRNFWGVRGI